MKPHVHCKNSTNKYGGVSSDYAPIHDFMDSTKACYAELAHRAILHNTFGIFLAEKVFGQTILNSDGKAVSVRSIAEDHVFEDLGFIPSIQDWLEDLPDKGWMHGMAAGKKHDSKIKKLEQWLDDYDPRVALRSPESGLSD